MLERPDGERVSSSEAADVALGIALRSLQLRQIQDQEEGRRRAARSRAASPSPPPIRRARRRRGRAASAVAEGVAFARDLVNEPANALGPVEFADQLKGLSKLGVDVKVLGEADLRKLKMGSLLERVAGLRAPAARGRHALVGRAGKGQAGRLHRQGRGVRHRRHLDQAGRRHGGHEGRHGRRRRGLRPDAHAGAPPGEGERDRHRRPGREHAGRQGARARATSSPPCPARRSR